MFRLIKDTNIDFVGKRRIAIVISGLIILAGLISLLLHGGPRLSIDFEGGTLLEVRFNDPTSVEAVRTQLSAVEMGEAVIQQYGDDREYIIRVKTPTQDEDQLNIIYSSLNQVEGGNGFDLRRLETVGPKIGKELRADAIEAILIAMLGIVIYVSIRFQFMYSIGALVALAHDVLITLGLFSLLNMEVSLTVLAAFMFIVGYSLNDTIVVFDRVREYVKAKRHEDFPTIVNLSLNSVLNRTIITSLTTLIVVLILFLFGGEVIKPFAFALIVGLVVGTYSSIYIASPIVIAWVGRTKKARK